MKIMVKFDKIESEREERISNLIVEFVDLLLEFMETQNFLIMN